LRRGAGGGDFAGNVAAWMAGELEIWRLRRQTPTLTLPLKGGGKFKWINTLSPPP
jgi:hypothetical protein